MPNKSKIKGTAYETKIRDKLTEFYKVDFKRVPYSGALEGLKGDLYIPKLLKEFPFVIEVKHYKEISIKNMLWAKSNVVLSFWEQATREAVEMAEFFGCKKLPLVVFRWDRGQNLVLWNTKLNLEQQFQYSGFNTEFKIGILEEWLQKNQELKNMLSSPK